MLAPIALGVVAFVTIGSMAAGTPVAPGPISPVGAASTTDDGPLTEASAAPATLGQLRAAPLPKLPDARQSLPADAPPLSRLVGYRWPLPTGRLTQPFGLTRSASRIVDGRPFHDGIDLATFCGDRILAAHDGVVLAAGRRYDDVIGWLGDLAAYYERLDAKKLWSSLPIVVVIDDGNGYRSMYAHFEKVVVKPGEEVLAGDLLGYEGRTGHASGCHLHYGLYSPFERDEIAIEPGIAARMKLPRAEIARVDPLLVLPPRPLPTPRPAAKPTPRLTP